MRELPLQGAQNPSSDASGTNPGSFANASDVGGPRAYSSPDTPGMPAPSGKTAWDFMPPVGAAVRHRPLDRAAGFAPAPSSSPRVSASSRRR